MTKIEAVTAREILDSRGKPTVEAAIHVTGGLLARASVPSGASTGMAEAHELRDGSALASGRHRFPGKLDSPVVSAPIDRYDGLGVQQAVANVIEQIAPAVVGLDVTNQAALDNRLIALDGTPNKSRLGANAILAVSLSACRAAALATGLPLYKHIRELSQLTTDDGQLTFPRPMTNMISGGKHAGGNLDVQDVLIAPAKSVDYPTQLEWIVRVYRRLGKLLTNAGYEGYLVGDEGGYGPRLKSNREAVEFVVRAVEAAGLAPGTDMTIALDVAATHFYKDGGYFLAAEQGQRLASSQMIDRLETWITDFPITSIEDGLAESDWTGWQELTARLGSRVTLVGDDLFATNAELLSRGIREGVANAVLIKLNQIGTLTETLATIQLAREHNYQTIISARSGETEDDFLADFAVGVQGDYIKIGSIVRSERLSKYNQLLRIWEEIS